MKKKSDFLKYNIKKQYYPIFRKIFSVYINGTFSYPTTGFIKLIKIIIKLINL